MRKCNMLPTRSISTNQAFALKGRNLIFWSIKIRLGNGTEEDAVQADHKKSIHSEQT